MSENSSANTQGKDYDKLSKHSQFIYGKEFIDNLPFKPSDNVLDIGCGTGGLTEYTARNKVPEGRVTAFDPDKQRIEIAKDNFDGVQNIIFHEGTALEFLRDKRNLYDVIYSNVVLNWIPTEDRKPTFQAIYAAAEPGGTIAHQYARREPEYSINVRGLLTAEDQDLGNSMYFALEPDEVNEIALGCGFEIVSSDEIISRSDFGVDDFFRWLEATCHGRIPFRQRHDEAIAKGIINTGSSNDGKVTKTVHLLRTILRKPDFK